MKKNRTKDFGAAAVFLAAFAAWTVAVRCLDVRAIGPNGSSVGFAAVNGWFHALTGVHMALYTLTDWLGLVPVGIAAGFALLGLMQLIRRRRFLKVDFDILALGGFYLIVMAAYLLFETVVVNYRPVLIEGYLEPSYPSSTTLLVLCVIPTAMMQLNGRIVHAAARRAVMIALAAFAAFMVIGRLISGVHWLTDIVGGVLISAALLALFSGVLDILQDKLGNRKGK